VDLVSDCKEDTNNSSLPPTRIIPAWRSKILSNTIELLDEAAIQLAKPGKAQIDVLHLLRHGESYDEENTE
jgi:hypothetical protein